MSEPSVDEIVAAIEAEMKKPRAALNIDTRCVRALIADWRKRGEAAEAMRAKCEAVAREYRMDQDAIREGVLLAAGSGNTREMVHRIIRRTAEHIAQIIAALPPPISCQ